MLSRLQTVLRRAIFSSSDLVHRRKYTVNCGESVRTTSKFVVRWGNLGPLPEWYHLLEVRWGVPTRGEVLLTDR